MLAPLKILTHSKDCSESSIRISDSAFLLCHWSIFSFEHVIAMQLLELFLGSLWKQLLEPQLALHKMELVE
jgi:hypothetical protein